MPTLEGYWRDVEQLPSAVTVMLVALAAFLAAVIFERVFVRILRRAYWRRVDRAAAARGVEELSRMKRQKTLVTLLESLVRYVVYGAATVIVLGTATDGRATAVLGASLVVVVGFGMQRLLGDVIAGVLLLFEGQFAVGDVITVHAPDVTGTVEEFTLRTTALRTLGGDRIVIMNGAITSMTRWSYGQREHRLELIARGDDVADAVRHIFEREGSAAHGLWVRRPAVLEVEHLGEDMVRVVGSVVLAPGHDAIIKRMVALLECELGERLVGPVTAVPLYVPAFEAWRAGLLVRE